MSIPRVAVVAAVAVACSEGVRVFTQTSLDAYHAFLSEFRVGRSHSEHELDLERVALFEQRRDEVRRHNAQPGITWIAAVNKFADYTDDEFKAMLGHRLSARAANRATVASLLEINSPQQLATAVDWSLKLNTSTHVKDQGGCGSCWAVATVGALETHLEIAGTTGTEVSYEELVDCTPNPDECGGSGGCNGATAELAMEYVHKHGLGAKAGYKGYQSGASGSCTPPKNPVLTTQGFVRLEENKLQPLLEAVSTKGPVVVSADASSWNSYSKGVFDSCEKDATINHAILAMGYGTDKELKRDYWLIRNSWGPDWGEQGYIRLLRHSGDDFCGTDHAPLDGVGCKGGPATLPVCGMCGVLSDSAYPSGVAAAKPAEGGKLV